NPYTCAGKEGNSLFCKLPLPGHTDFTPQANIVFVPDPEHLCDAPRAPAPDVDMDEVDDVTPIDDEDYNLEDLADVTDDHAYRRWMVDSQKKNNILLKRILKGITVAALETKEISQGREQGVQGRNRLVPRLEERGYRGTGGQLVTAVAANQTESARTVSTHHPCFIHQNILFSAFYF